MDAIGPALISAASSIIVGLLAFFGVLLANTRNNAKLQEELKTNQAVTDAKLIELTREVRDHNKFAVRLPVLEEKNNSNESAIAELKLDIRELKSAIERMSSK